MIPGQTGTASYSRQHLHGATGVGSLLGGLEIGPNTSEQCRIPGGILKGQITDRRCISDQDFGGKSDRPAVELSSVAGGRLTMLASGVGEGGGGVGAQPECSGELRRGSACASVRASATFGGGRVGTDEA